MSQNQRYTRITAEEFEDFLAGLDVEYEVTDVHGTDELVYDIHATERDDITVRIFTTLELDFGGNVKSARDAGADAIRCVVWDHESDRPIDGATRTHRIKTWRKNLAPKVQDMIDAAVRHASSRESAESELIDALEALPVETGADDELVVTDLNKSGQYTRLVVKTPYEARDAMRSLESWRTWDTELTAWLVDAAGLDELAQTAEEHGFTLTQVDRSPGVIDAIDAVELGDVVTVTYEAKSSDSELTKVGYVVDDNRDTDRTGFSFRRLDDDHYMIVKGRELWTSGSSFPFVGMITDVSVEEE